MSHLLEGEEQRAASCSKAPTVLSSFHAGAGQGFFCTGFFCPLAAWAPGARMGSKELSHFWLDEGGAAIQCKME